MHAISIVCVCVCVCMCVCACLYYVYNYAVGNLNSLIFFNDLPTFIPAYTSFKSCSLHARQKVYDVITMQDLVISLGN